MLQLKSNSLPILKFEHYKCCLYLYATITHVLKYINKIIHTYLFMFKQTLNIQLTKIVILLSILFISNIFPYVCSVTYDRIIKLSSIILLYDCKWSQKNTYYKYSYKYYTHDYTDKYTYKKYIYIYIHIFTPDLLRGMQRNKYELKNKKYTYIYKYNKKAGSHLNPMQLIIYLSNYITSINLDRHLLLLLFFILIKHIKYIGTFIKTGILKLQCLLFNYKFKHGTSFDCIIKLPTNNG